MNSLVRDGQTIVEKSAARLDNSHKFKGKVVTEIVPASPVAGKNAVRLELGQLAKGMYVLVMRNRNGEQRVPFVF